jgi:hypothetical protein
VLATWDRWVLGYTPAWTPDPVTPTGSRWSNGNNRLRNAGIGIDYDEAGNQKQVGAWTFGFSTDRRVEDDVRP